MKYLALLTIAFSTILMQAQHQATLYYQNPACTSSTPCALQVWRAVCSSVSKCPAFNPNSPTWQQLNSGSAKVTITASGTQWIVVDNDPSLQDNTTYAYCATNSFTSAPSVVSNCGSGWKGTTGAANANVPPPPTLSANGNSVN